MEYRSIKLRVRCESDSKIAQELLFAYGCWWGSQFGRTGQEPLNLSQKYLLVDRDGKITFCSSEPAFENSPFAEVDIRPASYQLVEITPAYIKIEGVKYNREVLLGVLNSVPKVE